MFLYISTYILLLSIFSLFPVRVRACCQYRENQHNCLAQRVTFNENEVMSNLHGWRYFTRARTAEAEGCSTSQVCKTDSPWERWGLTWGPPHPLLPCLPTSSLQKRASGKRDRFVRFSRSLSSCSLCYLHPSEPGELAGWLENKSPPCLPPEGSPQKHQAAFDLV